MSSILDQYGEIWLGDFEYSQPDGHTPNVRCGCFKEFHSKRELAFWGTELYSMNQPPFRIGRDALFVAFYTPAEMSCFIELGWGKPSNILDLFLVFRRRTNGVLPRKRGANSLLAACEWFAISTIDLAEKTEMRELAMRTGPNEDYTPEERTALIEYCWSDVRVMLPLLTLMEEWFDVS